MTDFLTAFFDVLLYPVNPAYLNFADDPIMVVLVMCILGIGIVQLFRKVVYGWFSSR